MKKILASVLAMAFVACGGGGGSSAPIDPVTTVTGPYSTVFGAACAGSEPTPGCTFVNGTRINVSADPNFNRNGNGSGDMWYVVIETHEGESSTTFTAAVYNEHGVFQYNAALETFAGYLGNGYFGVGAWTGGEGGNFSGILEHVAGGKYFLGKNGVLYSANYPSGCYGDNGPCTSFYGQAINSQDASEQADSSFAALNSDANKRLIQAATQGLVKDYGFTQARAKAVATALNLWAVQGAERGFTTEKDMSKTFKSVFGVQYSEAMAAVQGLSRGEVSEMRDLTERSAAALGLKPAQAQKFMKGMYKKSLASWGFDVDSINW